MTTVQANQADKDRADMYRFIAVALGLLVIGFLIVAQLAPTSIGANIDSAAVVTVVTTGAVVIERLLEGFWILIGLIRGSWWPLGTMKEQFLSLSTGLDRSFTPFYVDAKAKMDQLGTAATWANNKVEAAKKDLDDIKGQVAAMQKLPVDSQRVQLIVASANRSVDYFKKKYPELKKDADLAFYGLTSFEDFLNTFKDNPGRRLISLVGGMMLGLLIAFVLGLDVFRAVLETPPANYAVFPHLGVAVTGLVMGLGASPTHEVIQVLQQFKETQKRSNLNSVSNDTANDTANGTPASSSSGAALDAR